MVSAVSVVEFTDVGAICMTWFDEIPKVELHLHLEGAIPLAALWRLIQKYGGDPSVPDIQSLERRFQYRDFPHFIETWLWKNEFLREYEDFTFIAEAVARDLAAQNIRYVEAFFSPRDFAVHGLETQGLAQAIRAGLARVPEIDVALVADLVRNYGPVQGARTLAELREVTELGVIGIGIGGREDQFPPEPFAPLFDRAREYGFRTSAHAGEAAGAESVWGAVRSLAVDRIGHGTRAAEDSKLVEHLARHRIPLELCPISNVKTGVVRAIEHHPARTFFESDVIVTINTDDPKMFGNSLAREYELLHERLGFSRADIKQVIMNAVDVSWMPEEQKHRVARAVGDHAAWCV